MAVTPVKQYKPAKRTYKRKSKAKTKVKRSGVTKNQVLNMINADREVKKLYGKIKTTASNNLLDTPNGEIVPGFMFSEGATQYTTTCLNETAQGTESEMRIGNQLKPVSFSLKGYGFITDNWTVGNNVGVQTHVRIVCGFRRQSSPLSTANGKLLLLGGRESALTNGYQDILADFNWKEFRPFYDKTHVIAPPVPNNTNYQNPFAKNYFHFDIKYQYAKQCKNLVALESEAGLTTQLYNNGNIYVLFLARQMNNNGTIQSSIPIGVFAESLFQFTDP